MHTECGGHEFPRCFWIAALDVGEVFLTQFSGLCSVWRVSAVVSLVVGSKTALMLELCKLLRDELSIGAVSRHPLHCPAVTGGPLEHCGCSWGIVMTCVELGGAVSEVSSDQA